MSEEVIIVVNALEDFQYSTFLFLSLNVPMIKPTEPLVCSVALVTFDWLITLDHEVAYVWDSTWNVGRLLYFLSRYLVFIPAILGLFYQIETSFSSSVCGTLFVMVGWMNVIVILTAELILTVRTWALWDRRPSIGIFLGVISTIGGAVGIIGYCFYNPSYKFVTPNGISIPPSGCLTYTSDTPSLWWSFLALAIHQTLISLLTLKKCVEHYWTETYGPGLSLITTFYIDGFIYYIVMILLSLVNFGLVFLKNIPYTFLLLCLQRTFHSIISARILLHARHQAARHKTTELDSRLIAEIFLELDNIIIDAGKHELPIKTQLYKNTSRKTSGTHPI